MLTRLRQRLTYANVMATIAVFIALGGSGYAAVSLQRNSVKGKHIAKNAVTSSKVKNRSLKRIDFARGQLPKGDQGPKGDRGAPGPGEEAAISFSAPDGSPATVKTQIFSGDGLILEASCGNASNSNLTLWVSSTVNDGILTFTRVNTGAPAGTSGSRDNDLDPAAPYAFAGVPENTGAGGTLSWKSPDGAQLSGTWQGNGATATGPCHFDALLLRHH
ncbi:MAG: hypothetical protein QOE69_3224 [Thermoleophilaceae bacterium]|jgi:hypothetical protein|nr:hypothetical protein [Thermoleophilaceae bacterium]MEA2409105.1 hypothetical protein [Thermoleophilaceae bacterium]